MVKLLISLFSKMYPLEILLLRPARMNVLLICQLASKSGSWIWDLKLLKTWDIDRVLRLLDKRALMAVDRILLRRELSMLGTKLLWPKSLNWNYPMKSWIQS